MDRVVIRRAFTMLEILTVLGIIAVISAILLPALSSAKRRAKGTVDVSNMHQLFMALTLYEGDHNERDPHFLTQTVAYLKTSSVLASPLDTYRTPEKDGTWAVSFPVSCDGGTSPVKLDYAYIRTFFDADTSKPEEWLANIRANSLIGIIASPWLEQPSEFPTGAYPCGETLMEVLGPEMRGPVQRINMDGSLYIWPESHPAFGGSSFVDLFYSRR